jgi:hypothetical protein
MVDDAVNDDNSVITLNPQTMETLGCSEGNFDGILLFFAQFFSDTIRIKGKRETVLIALAI